MTGFSWWGRKQEIGVPESPPPAVDGEQTPIEGERAASAVRRPLQLGIRAGDDVEVLSGLEPTESVVLLRADALQEGQAVEVIEPEKK